MRRTNLFLAACTSALTIGLSVPTAAMASPAAEIEQDDRQSARALLEDILKLRTA